MNGISYETKKIKNDSVLRNNNRSTSKKPQINPLTKSVNNLPSQGDKKALYPENFDQYFVNSSVFSKIGGNIIGSQSINLNNKPVNKNLLNDANKPININSGNNANINSCSINDKNANFLNLFLGNTPGKPTSFRSKSNGRGGNAVVTRQPKQGMVAINKENYAREISPERDIGVGSSLGVMTNLKEIPEQKEYIANGNGNMLIVGNELLELHCLLWDSLLSFELNSDNKIYLNMLSKSYFSDINDHFIKFNNTLDIFDTSGLNKIYQKLLKFSLVIIIYLRFLISDFNYETTIKAQVKKLFSTFNNEFIPFLDVFIMPYSNVVKEKKEIFEKYSILTKIHKKKAKDAFNKSAESISTTIRQFSNNFFKMGYFKPIHMACFDLLKQVDNLSFSQIFDMITNYILFSLLSEKEKKTTQTISNKQILFNSPTFSNNFIVNYNMPTPFLSSPSSSPYTLVLDLDETLTPSGGCFMVRPHCFEFLRQMSDFYEIVIFTAAMKDYADNILDLLDKEYGVIKHRLYRQHTSFSGPCVVKDLSKIGRDLSKTIIIDNIPENFKLQPNNGLFIKTWNGDINDTQLRDLGIILKDIYLNNIEDIRTVLKKLKEEVNRRMRKGSLNPYSNIEISKFL